MCVSWGFEWGTFAVTWPPTAVTLPPTAGKHSHSQVCASCQDLPWFSFIVASLQTDDSANIWQAGSCSGLQRQKTIAAKNKIIQLTALLLYSTYSIIIYSVCRLVELVFSFNYLMVLMCFHWLNSDKCRNPRINPLSLRRRDGIGDDEMLLDAVFIDVTLFQHLRFGLGNQTGNQTDSMS